MAKQTAALGATFNRSQVLQAFAAFIEPDAVTELRVPNAGGKKMTVSGYFDNAQDLANAAEKWSGRAQGVYLVPNLIDPRLLNRSANQVQEWAKTTTGDNEIL